MDYNLHHLSRYYRNCSWAYDWNKVPHSLRPNQTKLNNNLEKSSDENNTDDDLDQTKSSDETNIESSDGANYKELTVETDPDDLLIAEYFGSFEN